MRVLVLFELIPEVSKVYLFPACSEDEVETFREAHGLIVNAVSTAQFTDRAVDMVQAIIDKTHEDNLIFSSDPKDGKTEPINFGVPAESSIMIFCGFML